MRLKSLTISSVAVMLLIAPLSWADKGGRRSHGNGRWYQPSQEYAQHQQYDNPGYGLPPGLAKRNNLPPGLQKHLWKHGSLPPGLQKRIGPGPMYYGPYPDRCLPPTYNYAPMRPGVRIILDF